MEMQLFRPKGPFKAPIVDGPGGKAINPDSSAFWEEHASIANATGCYLFAIRSGKGMRPIYVGKATGTFKQEVLHDSKLARHYNPALVKAGKCTPVLFFVAAPKKKGKPNGTLISHIEDYLIKIAASANPEISNVQGTKLPAWGIQGLVRSGTGKRSNAAKFLRKCLGLQREGP